MPVEALHPMRLGELLDHTFSLYRRNFLLFAGIMVVPAVILGALNTLIRAALRPTLAALQPPNPALLLEAISTFGPLILLAYVAFAISFGLAQIGIVFATSQVFLGRTATIGALFRAARARIWKLLGLWLLIGLLITVYCSLAGVLVTTLVGLVFTLGGVAGPVRMWPAFVVLVIVTVILSVRYCLATPALLLEDSGLDEAIRRGISLVRGNGSRALLIFLTTMVVTYAAILLFSAPFLIAQAYLLGHGTLPPFWLRALDAAGDGLGQALTLPLKIMALVILYFDIRVRKEGLDLQMLIGSLGPPAGAPVVDAILVSPALPADLSLPQPARAPGSLGL